MISIQLGLDWPEEAKEAASKGDVWGAMAPFQRVGRDIPQELLVAASAMLNDEEGGSHIYTVSGHGRGFRIVARRVKARHFA